MASTILVKYLKVAKKMKEIPSFLTSAKSERLPGSFAARVLVAKGKIRIDFAWGSQFLWWQIINTFYHFAWKSGDNKDDIGIRASPCSAIPSITLLDLQQRCVCKCAFSGCTQLSPYWNGCYSVTHVSRMWQKISPRPDMAQVRKWDCLILTDQLRNSVL